MIMDQDRDRSPSLVRVAASHRGLAAVTLITAAAAILAACSGSSSHPQKSASASVRAPSTATSAATRYGDDAATLATRIPHCAGPHVEDIGDGAETGMVGKAACMLDGHAVVIYTWKDADSQESADSIIAASSAFHATGVGWTQTLGDDAAAGAQHAIAAAVAAALGGTVNGS